MRYAVSLFPKGEEMHTKRQLDSLSLRPAKVLSFAAVNDPRKTNRQLTEMELSKSIHVSTSILLPWYCSKESNKRQIMPCGKEHRAPMKVYSKHK